MLSNLFSFETNDHIVQILLDGLLNRQFILITYNRCQKDKKKFRERARCCESNTIFKSGPHTRFFF